MKRREDELAVIEHDLSVRRADGLLNLRLVGLRLLAPLLRRLLRAGPRVAAGVVHADVRVRVVCLAAALEVVVNIGALGHRLRLERLLLERRGHLAAHDAGEIRRHRHLDRLRPVPDPQHGRLVRARRVRLLLRGARRLRLRCTVLCTVTHGPAEEQHQHQKRRCSSLRHMHPLPQKSMPRGGETCP